MSCIVGFVNDSGRLQRVIGFATYVPPREPSQLSVHQGHQPFERAAVPAGPRHEQLCDASLAHVHVNRPMHEAVAIRADCPRCLTVVERQVRKVAVHDSLLPGQPSRCELLRFFPQGRQAGDARFAGAPWIRSEMRRRAIA
jgi:hypothetical protein